MRNCFEHHQKPVPEVFDQIQKGFKFHLYVSFQNREQSIGLDICEALVKINQKLGLNNFKLTVRLSEVAKGEKPAERWSPEYIEKEMMQYVDSLKKIWVCGPPLMNETFDRTLEKLLYKLRLKAHQIEVM